MPRIEEPPERRAAGTVAILFAEVDAHLAEGVHLHCCSDVDFLGAMPNVGSAPTEIAGKGSRPYI